jgi:hypothetical protein
MCDDVCGCEEESVDVDARDSCRARQYSNAHGTKLLS